MSSNLTPSAVYIYRGHIQSGSGRAARLGFPTINIPLERADTSGIFAAEVRSRDSVLPAVAYADTARGVLEAHILAGPIPDGNVEIALRIKLREDARFADEAALRAAIAADVAAARALFKL